MADDVPRLSESVDTTDDESSTASEGDESGEIDTEQVVEVAVKTNLLLKALMLEPQLNKSNPAASPKPLYFAADFVRRTYLEYIIPLLPANAPFISSKLANPFVIQYTPERPSPLLDGPGPDSPEAEQYLSDLSNWPEPDAELGQRFVDAIGRTYMIASALIDPVKGPTVLGGTFEFGEKVRDVAGMIVGGQAEEERVTEKYRREQGIDLTRR